MRCSLLIYLFLLSFGFVFAKKPPIEENATELGSIADSKEKVNQLNNQVDNLIKPTANEANCKRAKPIAMEAAKIAEKLNYKIGMARSYEQLTLIYKTLDYQLLYLKYKGKAALVDRGDELKKQDEKIQKQKADMEKQRLEAENIKREIDLLAKDNISNKVLIEKKQKELMQKEDVLNQKSGQLNEMTHHAEILATKNKVLKQDALIKELEIDRQKMQKYFMLSFLVVLFTLALVLFNLYKTKHHTARELAEKNEIILAEKKRSDELLLNILPLETANELKLNGKAIARDYEMVTVLFTDFKDFTIISESLSPKDLVDEIDMCYSAFDNITEKHNIEKIKTIGDAYLCASGIANEIDRSIKHNPENVIDAAFEIVAFMEEMYKKRTSEGRPFFRIRIGIHSGPLVAGVVGRKKFAYDIWGDTVNTAARIEQNSEPGKINISSVTYLLSADKYIFTHRGKIEAKNKGPIDMYFVDRKI